ncbi:SWIM zinc finger family protein [Pseudoduganella sp. S-14]|uniref:SWIM zinc finger family protein n=1 Tax=Pseudoduganella sp. S-14 TaxID=3404065 RepID=UPI003CED0A7A
MNATRTDLLELTPEALIALANAGFVKRAQKDVAEGNLPVLEELADATIRATYADGHCAVLGPNSTLRDASCTCPASGLCRHRVTLVLAYQAQAKALSPTQPANEAAGDAGPWSPSHFAATVAETVPASTLAQAARLAAAQPVVKLIAWQEAAAVPSARLPMCNVRFFSRSSLTHARCDCKEGSGCAHIVLAVWAFAQAELKSPDFAEASVTLAGRQEGGPAPVARLFGTQAAATLLERAQALALQVWLDGSSQPMLALEARFEEVLGLAKQLEWCWIGESLHGMKDLMLAQHARSSRFDPKLLLSALADLHARLAAAVLADGQAAAGQLPEVPASQLLGIGVKGEVALDHLRLLSLGAQLWADDEAEGALLVLADPDTLAVTVIERSWPKPKAGEPGIAIKSRRIAGQSVERLAASQVVTGGARRRANGALEIAAGARQTNVLPLSPRAWDDLMAPLRQSSAEGLRDYLLDAVPDFARPQQAIEHMHVVPVAQVGEWEWNAARQTLSAWIEVGQGLHGPGQRLLLRKRHNPAAPHAVDALASALSGQFGAPLAVSGTVTLEAGLVAIDPFAVLTEQRAVVPDVESTAARELPPAALLHEAPPLVHLAGQVHALLGRWMRQGLRHQAAGALKEAADLAAAMERNGLAASAGLLREAVALMQAPDKQPLPGKLATLYLLLAEIARSA